MYKNKELNVCSNNQWSEISVSLSIYTTHNTTLTKNLSHYSFINKSHMVCHIRSVLALQALQNLFTKSTQAQRIMSCWLDKKIYSQNFGNIPETYK